MLSDHVGESVQDEAERALHARQVAIKKKLLPIKLTQLDLTGEEFCSYMRIMGIAYGFLGATKPTEEDVALFEMKLRALHRVIGLG